MFYSSASLFNFFFTRWKTFSIGLMSGLLCGIENIRPPTSNIAFLVFKEFWLRSPSCRNNFPCGLLLFSKAFSKCCLLLTQNCFMTISDGYKHFHHFTPRALFFFLLRCVPIPNLALNIGGRGRKSKILLKINFSKNLNMRL